MVVVVVVVVVVHGSGRGRERWLWWWWWWRWWWRKCSLIPKVIPQIPGLDGRRSRWSYYRCVNLNDTHYCFPTLITGKETFGGSSGILVDVRCASFYLSTVNCPCTAAGKCTSSEHAKYPDCNSFCGVPSEALSPNMTSHQLTKTWNLG